MLSVKVENAEKNTGDDRFHTSVSCEHFPRRGPCTHTLPHSARVCVKVAVSISPAWAVCSHPSRTAYV